MDSILENYKEKWAAMRQEHDAKAEKLNAEKRIDYNNAFDDFEEEVSAAADWTDATWDEFKAKVDRKWQEFMINLQG
jgi:hypothetical protein